FYLADQRLFSPKDIGCLVFLCHNFEKLKEDNYLQDFLNVLANIIDYKESISDAGLSALLNIVHHANKLTYKYLKKDADTTKCAKVILKKMSQSKDEINANNLYILSEIYPEDLASMVDEVGEKGKRTLQGINDIRLRKR